MVRIMPMEWIICGHELVNTCANAKLYREIECSKLEVWYNIMEVTTCLSGGKMWTALKNLIIHYYTSFDLLVGMCFRKSGGFQSTHTLLIVELNTYFMIRRETQTLSQTLLCSKWNLDWHCFDVKSQHLFHGWSSLLSYFSSQCHGCHWPGLHYYNPFMNGEEAQCVPSTEEVTWAKNCKYIQILFIIDCIFIYVNVWISMCPVSVCLERRKHAGSPADGFTNGCDLPDWVLQIDWMQALCKKSRHC